MGIPSSTQAPRGRGLKVKVDTRGLAKLQRYLGQIGGAAADLRLHSDTIVGEILRQNKAGRKYRNRTGRMTQSWISPSGRDTIVRITRDSILFESRVPYAVFLFRRGFIARFDPRGVVRAIEVSLGKLVKRRLR